MSWLGSDVLLGTDVKSFEYISFPSSLRKKKPDLSLAKCKHPLFVTGWSCVAPFEEMHGMNTAMPGGSLCHQSPPMVRKCALTVSH